MEKNTVGKRRKREDEGQDRVGMGEKTRTERLEERGKVSSNWRKVEREWRETKMKGNEEE